MKITKLPIFLTIACNLCFSTNSHSSEGSGAKGGGTIISANFVNHGSFALKVLSKSIPEISNEALIDMFARTNVLSVDTIKFRLQDPLNGEILTIERDAEYIESERLIRFNQKRFTEMSCTQKLSITSHEYLRALGLEESDYRYSNSFLNNNFTNDKILNEELVKMVESFCSQDSKLQNRNASFSKHNKNDEYTFKKRDYFTCLDSLKKEIDQDGYIYVDPNLISSSISPNSYTDLKVYEIKYGLLSIGGWHSNVYIGDMALRANILLNAKVEEAKKRHVLLGIKYNSIIQDQGFTFSNSVANLFKVSDMQISNGLQEQTLAIRWQHYLSKAAWALNTDSVATRSQGRSVIKSFDPKGGNLDLALEDQDLSKKLVEVIIAIEQHIQCSIK